jgi:hypothetical protein
VLKGKGRYRGAKCAPAKRTLTPRKGEKGERRAARSAMDSADGKAYGTAILLSVEQVNCWTAQHISIGRHSPIGVSSATPSPKRFVARSFALASRHVSLDVIKDTRLASHRLRAQ